MPVGDVKRLYWPMSEEPWVFHGLSILYFRAEKLDDYVGITSTHAFERHKAVSRA
jgi:hypothetical protein